MSAEEAVNIVQSGDVIATTGYGGNGTPEELLVALEKRFLETGAPKDLTLFHSTGQGDGKESYHPTFMRPKGRHVNQRDTNA